MLFFFFFLTGVYWPNDKNHLILVLTMYLTYSVTKDQVAIKTLTFGLSLNISINSIQFLDTYYENR